MSDLVCCLTNGNLEFQCDILDSVLNKQELLDVPIVIYSIAGPRRTGKSYLLNVFLYLLKKQHTHVDEEENEQTEIPQIFQSMFRSRPVTEGIYITTQPIFLYGENETKVAVFLMDTQGIRSGDSIKCKEGDIFTISLELSYLQIVNVKSVFEYQDADTYASLTHYARRVKDVKPENKKLIVLVRDWVYVDEHCYGHEGGRSYYDELPEKLGHEIAFQCLNRFFETKECFLMPNPGNEVERSKSKRLHCIEKEAWLIILEVYDNLFSSLNIRRAYANAPKGKEILCLAAKLATKLQFNPHHAPDRSFQNYLDWDMKIKISKCRETYKNEMSAATDKQGNVFQTLHNAQQNIATKSLVANSSIENMTPYINKLERNLSKEYEALFEVAMKNQMTECLAYYKEVMSDEEYLKRIHDENVELAVSKLKSQNPIQERSSYVDRLRADAYAQYEIYVGRNLCKEFVDEWSKNIRKEGNFQENTVVKFFTREGLKYLQRFKTEIKDENSRSVVLIEFIKQFNEQFSIEIKRRIKNKTIVGATCGGVIVGGLLVLIPPLGAVAAGSALATELAVTPISGGLGIAGGAVAGTVSALLTGEVSAEIKAPDLKAETIDRTNDPENDGMENCAFEMGGLHFIQDDGLSPGGSVINPDDIELDDNQTGEEDDHPLIETEETRFVRNMQDAINRIVRQFDSR